MLAAAAALIKSENPGCSYDQVIEIFNTNIHECIETKKIDSKEKGIVLEVVRRGYYFEGKVMRSALVITTQ